MINDNLNTREDLIKLLKNYKGILSNKVINYLESLIELEFSVIKNNIDINDRIVLSELEIYKKIAIYNIYNKALKIFNENSQNLNIFFNQDVNGRVFIFTHLNEINVKLFEFNYNEFLILNDKIPKDYKLMKIGTISLYKTLENKEFRIEELNRIESNLKTMYEFCNNTIYEQNSMNFYCNYHDIIEYENKIRKLKNKENLNEEEIKEINITNFINRLFLEDYGLTYKDFKDENENNLNPSKSKLRKTLVKRMPNLIIEENIRYI